MSVCKPHLPSILVKKSSCILTPAIIDDNSKDRLTCGAGRSATGGQRAATGSVRTPGTSLLMPLLFQTSCRCWMHVRSSHLLFQSCSCILSVSSLYRFIVPLCPVCFVKLTGKKVPIHGVVIAHCTMCDALLYVLQMESRRKKLGVHAWRQRRRVEMLTEMRRLYQACGIQMKQMKIDGRTKAGKVRCQERRAPGCQKSAPHHQGCHDHDPVPRKPRP